MDAYHQEFVESSLCNTIGKYKFGHECLFQCKQGFFSKTNGKVKSECLNDGTFDLNLRQCKKVNCDERLPDNVNNQGDSRCDSTKVSDQCRLKCVEGYFREGGLYDCKPEGNQNGIWSLNGSESKCVAINCTLPPELMNMTKNWNKSVSCQDKTGNLGRTCELACEKGYYLTGSSSISCEQQTSNAPTVVWKYSGIKDSVCKTGYCKDVEECNEINPCKGGEKCIEECGSHSCNCNESMVGQNYQFPTPVLHTGNDGNMTCTEETECSLHKAMHWPEGHGTQVTYLNVSLSP